MKTFAILFVVVLAAMGVFAEKESKTNEKRGVLGLGYGGLGYGGVGYGGLGYGGGAYNGLGYAGAGYRSGIYGGYGGYGLNGYNAYPYAAVSYHGHPAYLGAAGYGGVLSHDYAHYH